VRASDLVGTWRGDLLTLSTKPMTLQGVERKAELVWERVGRD
jgi:hypothetical protein